MNNPQEITFSVFSFPLSSNQAFTYLIIILENQRLRHKLLSDSYKNNIKPKCISLGEYVYLNVIDSLQIYFEYMLKIFLPSS